MKKQEHLTIDALLLLYTQHRCRWGVSWHIRGKWIISNTAYVMQEAG